MGAVIMGRPKKQKKTYGTVELHGHTYYRTRITDPDGHRIPIYGVTVKELEEKVEIVRQEITDTVYHRDYPTVAEYAADWLTRHAAHIRPTTLVDYASKIKNHIVKPLGDMYMADVTADDIERAMVPVSQLSASTYRGVHLLYKMIFKSAEQSHIIDDNPAANLNPKGGKSPKELVALTDEQVQILLDAIRYLPPYPFVMIGLYAGLRREEILALQWDAVHLDGQAPYIEIKRAWHAEHNRPVISDDLKTKAARRSIPIPPQLSEFLRTLRESATSDYVITNSDGGPLSYTQFKRLWAYIKTRSTMPRTYTRYHDGVKEVHTVTPRLGEVAAHNSHVIYSIDFNVTPHQLRRTYITNLIHAGIDPKRVQYLAGHKNIKITMDIYARVKYNRPEEMSERIADAFASYPG